MKLADNLVFPSDDHRLAHDVSSLIYRVTSNHDVESLPQMVLHEIGKSFDLKTATYLIDNPDFDYLLGVAGYHQDERHDKEVWNSQEFRNFLQKAKFHNNVAKVSKGSLIRLNIDLDKSKDVLDIANNLGMQDPERFTWKMKFNNYGILLFEEGEKSISDWRYKLLKNAAYMLSFCAMV